MIVSRRTTAFLYSVLICCASIAPTFAAGATVEALPPTPKDVQSYKIDTNLVRPYRGKDFGRELVVWTPPGYSDPANRSQRYPVLYLLHGSPGNPWNFIHFGLWPDETAQLVRQNLIIPPILVMPDGNYVGEKHGDCEWVNSADGNDKFTDFVCKDVVDWTDSHYRTIPNPTARIIGGVSEGAYGAVNIALRHPDVFGNVLALSGYYLNDGSGWAREIMGSDPTYIAENSPLSCVQTDFKSLPANWRRTRFFLGAGDSENRYTIETKQLSDALADQGVEVHLQILKGKHGWKLWNQLYCDGASTLLARTLQKQPLVATVKTSSLLFH